MAKIRHRIFEMYEVREEAAIALTPRTEKPATEATAPETWTFRHLAVSRSTGVTHVVFKEAQNFGEETVSDLSDDFGQLANKLDRDSKVLLDFTGVKSYCVAAIKALILFNQKLQTKGSRIALCCLDPAAKESFFAAR